MHNYFIEVNLLCGEVKCGATHKCTKLHITQLLACGLFPPQSRQSAKLFLQLSKLGLLTPSHAGSRGGGVHTCLQEGGRGLNSNEGTDPTDTVVLQVYIFTLCSPPTHSIGPNLLRALVGYTIFDDPVLNQVSSIAAIILIKIPLPSLLLLYMLDESGFIHICTCLNNLEGS